MDLLLFAAAFLAAAVSGIVGFGGALLLLPVLVHAVGAADAVPLLTVAQLVGNASRAAFGFTAIDWPSVRHFSFGAIPASALGALLFTSLPTSAITRVIGVALLVFVALRATRTLDAELPAERRPRVLVAGGAVVGLVSGIVGSAGPLSAAVFLSLGLPPLAYVATDATASLLMHAAKSLVYHQQLEYADGFARTALLLSAGMLLGTALGRGVVHRVSPALFQRLVMTMLTVVALQMLITG